MEQLVKEAKALAKKAIEYDKCSFVDAAAYYYQLAARLLREAAESEGKNKQKLAKIWLQKAEEYKNRADYIMKPKTYKQLRQPENIMFGQCRFLFTQALDADEKGEIEEAINLYQEAKQVTLSTMSKVTNQNLKEKLDFIMKQATERQNLLKERKSQSPTKRLSSADRDYDLLDQLDRATSLTLRLSGKSDLSETEKRVLMITSRINSVEYVPFMMVDYNEKFEFSNKFMDKDGLLKLSPKQSESFDRWMRPSEIYTNPQLIIGPCIDCFTIKQTIISDCSFVASLSVAALYEKKFGRRLISSIIFPRKKNKEPIYNPSGKYMVKLLINGIPRKVIIDDRLPVNKNRELLSSFSTRKGEMWISLLEKAYMKVMGGYDFPGSNSNIDLHALTGWIPERIMLKTSDKNFNAEALFKMIMSRLKKGDALMTVATPDMTEAESTRAGLVPLHAYAILDITEVNGERLFQLKNPWSHVRWRGNYSELDVHHWTKSLCTQLDYNPKNAAYFDNGVFWIDYKSLLHFFEVLYINWNPNMFLYTDCVHQAWSAGVGPAKDCYTIGENPQFRLKIDPKITTGAAWILLSRHITDIDDFKYNKEYITVLVYNNNGKKVYYPYDPPPVVDGLRVNSPHYLAKLNLQETKARDFTLVISQYEKSTTIYYTLRCYSTVPFKLTNIPDPYVHVKKVLDGEWKGRTAGGCRNYKTYDENPEYVLSVKGGGSLVIDLKAPAQIRIGFDVYPENKESLWKAVSSGPYRLGFVVMEIEQIPPGDYSIVPTTFKPKEEARFFLTVKSTCPIQLEKKLL